MLYKKILRLGAILMPVLYMLWIWLQSSHFNPSSIEHVFYDMDLKLIVFIGGTLELAHLIEFGLLYLFIVVAFLTYGKLTRKKEIISLSIALCYSLIDEFHQLYVPFRSFSLIDIVKNFIGVWVFWLIVHKNYFTNKDTKIGTILKGIGTISDNKSM